MTFRRSRSSRTRILQKNNESRAVLYKLKYNEIAHERKCIKIARVNENLIVDASPEYIVVLLGCALRVVLNCS